MAQRISILVALDGSDDGLKRALSSAERSLGDLASSAKTAGEKASAGVAEVKAGMSAFGEQVDRAKTQLLAFLTINWAVGKVQEIVQIADAWNMMAARLKLATAGQREYVTAQQELFAIAQRIGVPIQETATLYGKLQQAVRMLGGEQKEALTITETIAQALRLSGASATEAQAALLQFGQALASGVLRGEEFNSVVENSPRLAQALADGLDVPIGRLRKMAEEGRLTADVVINALLSQKDKLAAEYAQLPLTVAQSFERLRNAFGQWVSQVDTATGTTKKLAEVMTWLAQNLDTVLQWLQRIAEVGLAVLVYRLIPALITAWQTAGAAAVTAANATAAAWATANLSVSAAVTSVGLLKTAFSVLGAFLVGWEIGIWLSEKFEIVRKAGIFMVEVLVKAFEELRFRWEVFAAIFTSDTIAEATKRHQARLAEMNALFAQMYADAGKGTEAAKTAMNTAGSAAEEIAKRLEAVRQGTQEAVGRGVEAIHAAVEKLKSRLGEVEQAVGKAMQTVNDATAKMAEAYKGLTTIVEGNLQRQIDAVKTRYQQEQQALDLTSQSQTAWITRSTQLLTEALLQQTTLRRQATTDTLKLIDDESKARLEAATRQGQTEAERAANVQRVENEILATKRQTMTQALAEYRQHIDALNAEANRHLTEVKRIEEEKRQLALTTDERIREIVRQGLSTFEATEDRKRQVVEYQTQARAALANGELDLARELAQKAMDLAAQVASTQTSEAKRAEDARRQSEQSFSQVAQLEAQSREAYRNQEYAKADALMRQADALRAEIAQKTRDADAAIARGKADVANSIGAIRASEEILNQTLDAETAAHKRAAQAALSARDEIKQTLAQTETQIDQITVKLKDGLKVTIDADTQRFNTAIAELDKALAEKERLLKIQADLTAAEQKLREYEQALKEGKTLPVDADVAKAKAALAELKAYADEKAQVELKVATEKALGAITNVESQIKALNGLETESRHLVSSNVDAARSEILSLNGMNTSSTHTIYVQRVETNASGGLVGAGVPGFATGGAVATGFPWMRGGTVPGTGNGDTVPRTLEGGAFVLRKAAVQKYGARLLARVVQGFAAGGPLRGGTPAPRQVGVNLGPPKAGGVDTARKVHDLKVTAERELGKILERAQGLPPARNGQDVRSYVRNVLELIEASNDPAEIQAYLDHLLVYYNAFYPAIENSKRMHVPLVMGVNYAAGGSAASDSVPAMLTPGEYVVNKEAVARYGVDFFARLNNLTLPARALAQRVQGFASGGLVSTLSSMLPVPRPVLATDAGPVRTVRLELAAGDRKINAAIDARDEARLLQLLEVARARAI